MNKLYILLLILIGTCSCKQYANFETTVHKEDATKDGIYLDDYVVHIDHEQILKLDNKKIRLKGKYTIVEGLDPNDTVISQGRAGDTKHILNPKIRIIE